MKIINRHQASRIIPSRALSPSLLTGLQLSQAVAFHYRSNPRLDLDWSCMDRFNKTYSRRLLNFGLESLNMSKVEPYMVCYSSELGRQDKRSLSKCKSTTEYLFSFSAFLGPFSKVLNSILCIKDLLSALIKWFRDSFLC